ncbi:MAG: EAL domain-containing protein, partial [Burkholderiaceae bacterium]|nr:EAL domain-containing protein [Burkholderiaceae bacterium]
AAGADITEHKASEERIHHLAHHDVLTDLPNRSLCLERLRMAVEQAGRTGEHVGVVFIDLDRFKNINDSMGHHVGDALLRSVSKRLLSAVRAGDTVSRLGGDEFVVVLNGVSTVEEIARIVDERMLPLVREPHVVEGVQLHVSCSAGMAVYPQDGRDIDHLMRHADAAMYQAKSGGRDHALFFTPEFHAQAQERLAIENDLRDVVARGELLLNYQPRIEAASGRVTGMEALVRWQRPDQGLVSPAIFIPIAEETGQIVPIGAWIFGEACRQHAVWRDAGLGSIPISVNVSVIQLRDPSLPTQLREMMNKHRVDPSMIELELTETFLMENAIFTVDSLEKLKEIGVSLSIDDFGTGYSSLNYLHQFPIDKLKIDQSFVRDILDDPTDWAITKAIIGLGHTLGLRVVAEGVERDQEAEWLRDAGCDELQGFLFSRPMAAEAVQAWLVGRSLAPTPAPHARLNSPPARTRALARID